MGGRLSQAELEGRQRIEQLRTSQEELFEKLNKLPMHCFDVITRGDYEFLRRAERASIHPQAPRYVLLDEGVIERVEQIYKRVSKTRPCG